MFIKTFADYSVCVWEVLPQSSVLRFNYENNNTASTISLHLS